MFLPPAQLLDSAGAAELEEALVEVIERNTVHVGAVRQVVDRRRSERGLPAPVTIPVAPGEHQDLVVTPLASARSKRWSTSTGNWPKKIDREAIDELFSLGFLKTGHNGVLVGPNGVGKTMILKNIAHQALVRGHTVRFATASDMLADLAAQDSSSALARRLRRYTVPQLLCVDEVGYLSYDSRYADRGPS